MSEMNFYNSISKSIRLAAVIGMLATGSIYADGNHHEQPSNTTNIETIQTECPVMIGKEINPEIYSDYKGKRVYFCCPSCKASFDKDPEKYLGRLPQFNSTGISDHHSVSSEPNGILLSTMSGLIVPTGATTLSLVATAVFLSTFRRINVRLMMRWHKRIGMTALIVGAIHATLVLIAH